jgi:regulator of sigma E protease
MIAVAFTPESVVRVLAIVLIFGLMIVVHELGHLIVARLARMRVHEFSVGFGPALLSLRKVGGRWRASLLPGAVSAKPAPVESTPEYRAELDRLRDSGVPPAQATKEAAQLVEEQRAAARSAPPESVTWSIRPFIPVGGYVNIAGLDPGENVPDGFDKRPVGWRMGVVVAGSLMNVILAIAIYIVTGSLLGFPGEPQPVVGKVFAGRPAARAGLQAGDRFVSVGQVTEKQVRRIRAEIEARPGETVPVVVERAGERVSLQVVPAATTVRTPLLTIRGMQFAGLPHEEPYVARVAAGTPASRAGIEAGDLIERVAGLATGSIGGLHKALAARAARSVEVTVRRDHATRTLTLAASPAAQRRRERDLRYYPANIEIGQIGITFYSPVQRLGLSRAIDEGFASFGAQLRGLVSGLVLVLTRRVPAEVTGPVGITRILYESAEVGWRSFLALAAALCLWIAVINLIPLPALDGGRLAFLVGEAVRGKPLLAPAREAIVHVVGLMLFLAVVLLVTYKDIVDWVHSR